MASLYMGLTDVFVSASGIVILLIVLLANHQGRPAYWPEDLRLHCPAGGTGGWRLTATTGDPLAVFAEIEGLIPQLPRDRLHVNLLVLSRPADFRCVPEVQAMLDRYHGSLGRRGGAVGPIVATEWLPVAEEPAP